MTHPRAIPLRPFSILFVVDLQISNRQCDCGQKSMHCEEEHMNKEIYLTTTILWQTPNRLRHLPFSKPYSPGRKDIIDLT